jgi:hypothetical protein
MFDLSVLPQKAQDELTDFYHFLVERYGQKKGKKIQKAESRVEKVDEFFDQYNLNLNDFSFNRNEIYER